MTRHVVEEARRDLAATHEYGLSRSAAIPLVGLRRPALSRRAASPCRSTRGRPHPPSWLDQFRHRAAQIIAEHGILIASNQVQYSWSIAVRTRAWRHGAGSRVGPLLTTARCSAACCRKDILGAPNPVEPSSLTASLRKYKQMIDVWGGWALFQELLTAVARIAGNYRADVSAVAIRVILDRPAVAGVIVGGRLGVVRAHRFE